MKPEISIFEAVLLGIIEGVTEFLPVSGAGMSAMLIGLGEACLDQIKIPPTRPGGFSLLSTD